MARGPGAELAPQVRQAGRQQADRLAGQHGARHRHQVHQDGVVLHHSRSLQARVLSRVTPGGLLLPGVISVLCEAYVEGQSIVWCALPPLLLQQFVFCSDDFKRTVA